MRRIGRIEDKAAKEEIPETVSLPVSEKRTAKKTKGQTKATESASAGTDKE